jgi:predicted enzyme related to lactoylglutathione lyase
MDGNTMVAQLHRWEAHEHPHLGDESNPSRGNGVLLWFATDDFDALCKRVEKAGAKVVVAKNRSASIHAALAYR